MGKRKSGQPGPWIDLWGKPTWDNPYGQLPPNPEFTGRKRRRVKSAHEAAEPETAVHEAVEQPTVEHEAPTARAPWRRQAAGGTTA